MADLTMSERVDVSERLVKRLERRVDEMEAYHNRQIAEHKRVIANLKAVIAAVVDRLSDVPPEDGWRTPLHWPIPGPIPESECVDNCSVKPITPEEG